MIAVAAGIAPPQVEPLDLDLGRFLVRLLVTLLFLGAAAFFALYLARRRGWGGPTTRGAVLRGVVDRMALGPKHSLVVVEVAGRYLLLGVGDDGVRRIAELDEAEVREALRDHERGRRRAAPRVPILASRGRGDGE